MHAIMIRRRKLNYKIKYLRINWNDNIEADVLSKTYLNFIKFHEDIQSEPEIDFLARRVQKLQTSLLINFDQAHVGWFLGVQELDRHNSNHVAWNR